MFIRSLIMHEIFEGYRLWKLFVLIVRVMKTDLSPFWKISGAPRLRGMTLVRHTSLKESMMSHECHDVSCHAVLELAADICSSLVAAFFGDGREDLVS